MGGATGGRLASDSWCSWLGTITCQSSRRHLLNPALPGGGPFFPTLQLRARTLENGTSVFVQELPRVPYRGAKIMSSQPHFLQDYRTGLNTTRFRCAAVLCLGALCGVCSDQRGRGTRAMANQHERAALGCGHACCSSLPTMQGISIVPIRVPHARDNSSPTKPRYLPPARLTRVSEFHGATKFSMKLYCNTSYTPWCRPEAITNSTPQRVRHAATVAALTTSV